jgi:hypothetical protein
MPNLALFISGWFAFAFGCLHLYPPMRLQQLIKRAAPRLPASQRDSAAAHQHD